MGDSKGEKKVGNGLKGENRGKRACWVRALEARCLF